MKKRFPFSALILLPIIFNSCTKGFLDTLPKGLVIAEKTDDFRKLLDNVDTRYTYNLAQVSGYVDVVSDNSQMDSTWYDWESNRLHAKQLYAFEPDVWLPDGPPEDLVWKQNFYVSTLVSNILDEIHIADDNVKLQSQLTAEARVHRAYAYLTLVNIYAKHYNKSTASTDLGVPLIGNPAKLPSLERASVQEIYDFILQELLESADALPDDITPQFSHRPTKISTYAILARTYLYMANYEKALEYAEKSLAIRDYLYDYNSIYTGEPSPANVIGLSRTSDDEMLLHKTLVKGVSQDMYLKLDTTSFNELFTGYTRIDETTVENNDLRRTLWFSGINANGDFTGKRLTYEFKNYRYSLDAAIVDYIPVSTPEVYLTRAECNARLNHLQEAVADINKIRMHRYVTGTYTPLNASDLSQDDVLKEVLTERRRELYGSELRLFDIKRLNLPVTHLEPGKEEVGYQVSANDPKLIWPIYPMYIELNPEIEQNQR